MLEAVADGDTATLVRTPREVSTQQAATVLNVSRPTVVKVTITRDAHAEPNETLALTLHSPVGARLGTPPAPGPSSTTTNPN